MRSPTISSFLFLQSIERVVYPHNHFLLYILISLVRYPLPPITVSGVNPILVKSNLLPLRAYTLEAKCGWSFSPAIWNQSHFAFMTMNLSGALGAAWLPFLNEGLLSHTPLSGGSPPFSPATASPSLLLFVPSPQMSQGFVRGPLCCVGSPHARVLHPASWLYQPSISQPLQNSYFQPGPSPQSGSVSETSSRLIYFLTSPLGRLISTLTCSKLSYEVTRPNLLLT